MKTIVYRNRKVLCSRCYLAANSMMLWANWLEGMTIYADIPNISVRLNVLGLLARNLLQGEKERQSEVFRVMYLTPHLIDPQHLPFRGRAKMINNYF